MEQLNRRRLGANIMMASLKRGLILGVIALLFISSLACGAETDGSKIRSEGPKVREALERVANERQTKLVVTRHAYKDLERTGAEQVDRLLVSREIVNGWRILYSREEDPEVAIAGYEKNLRIWNAVFDKAAVPNLGAKRQINTLGAEASAINQIMCERCQTRLELSVSAGKVPITIVDPVAVRTDALCQDYMLFLAASGITVKRALNHVIGVTRD